MKPHTHHWRIQSPDQVHIEKPLWGRCVKRGCGERKEFPRPGADRAGNFNSPAFKLKAAVR